MKRFVVLLILLVLAAVFVAAETISEVHLVDGQIITGTIIEKQTYPEEAIKIQAEDGTVYVVRTSAPQVTAYSPSCTQINTWRAEDFGGSTRFKFLCDLAVGTDGSVFVVDSEQDCVHRIYPDGVSLRTYGDAAGGTGYLTGEDRIAIDSMGRVLIANYVQNKIHVLNQDWEYLLSWGKSGSPSSVP